MLILARWIHRTYGRRCGILSWIRLAQVDEYEGEQREAAR